MSTVRLGCRDACEAQKLASLAYRREAGQTFVSEVLNVVGDEAVLALRDGSAHSITLADASQVEALADFLQSVTEGSHMVSGASASGRHVVLAKSDRPRARAGA